MHINAFNELYQKYFCLAYDLARSLGIPKESCDDIIQDIFLKVFKKIKHFDIKREFFSWFYKLAKNTCIDYLRSVKNRTNLRKDELRADILRYINAEDLDTILTIRNVIRELDFEEKEVVFLRYYIGMTGEEISKLTGFSERKIYYMLKNFKDKLTEKLNKFPP